MLRPLALVLILGAAACAPSSPAACRGDMAALNPPLVVGGAGSAPQGPVR